jgi:hypothetical protein
MPSAPSRIAASKLARVFSGKAEEAFTGHETLRGEEKGFKNIHRDDPSNLVMTKHTVSQIL